MNNAAVLTGFAVAAAAAVWTGYAWTRARQHRRWVDQMRWWQLTSVTGVTRPDTEPMVAAVAAALASLTPARHTIIRNRGISVFLTADGGVYTTIVGIYGTEDRAEQIAHQIANACGLKAVELDSYEPPATDEPVRAAMVYARDPLNPFHPGIDALSTFYANELNQHPDAVIAIGFEPAREWEMKRLRRFLNVEEISTTGQTGMRGAGTATAAQAPIHALRARVIARAAHATRAETLVNNFGPLLDSSGQNIRAGTYRDWRYTAPIVVAAVVVAAVGAIWQTWLHPDNWTVWWWAPLPVAAAVGAWTHLTPRSFTERRIGHWLNQGLVYPERPWLLSPARAARSLWSTTLQEADPEKAGRNRRSFVANPYSRRTIVLTPRHITSLVLPPPVTATSAAAAGVKELAAPAAATSAAAHQGSRLGVDPDHRWIHIPWTDRKSGLVLIGRPGMGKSTFLLTQWGDDILWRTYGWPNPNPDQPNLPPARNGNITIWWLETKGEGAHRAATVAHTTGIKTSARLGDGGLIHLDLTQPTHIDWQLDWFGTTDPYNDPDRTVDMWAKAIAYAWGNDTFAARAQDAFRNALRLALAAHQPDIVTWLTTQNIRLGDNPLQTAAWLLGTHPQPGWDDRTYQTLIAATWNTTTPQTTTPPNRDDDLDDDLDDLLDTYDTATPQPGDVTDIDTILTTYNPTDPADPTGPDTSYANPDIGPHHPQLGHALDLFARWANRNRRLRDEWGEAVVNKLSELHNSRAFTPHPTARTVTIADLIATHHPVIINFRGSNPPLPEATCTRLTSLFLHLAWDHAQTVCSGWLDQQRSLALYCDEIAMISGAGDGDDIIRLAYDQGRALGWELSLATQRYEQLPPATRRAVSGFGHLIVLRFDAYDDARDAHRQLFGDNPNAPWGPDDIQRLPAHTGIAKLTIGSNPQPPFTIHDVPDDNYNPRPYDPADLTPPTHQTHSPLTPPQPDAPPAPWDPNPQPPPQLEPPVVAALPTTTRPADHHLPWNTPTTRPAPHNSPDPADTPPAFNPYDPTSHQDT